MPALAENTIEKAYIVPGLPHLAFDNDNRADWHALKAALTQAGKSARATRPDVLVIYSAQWISVLGHSFQADPNPSGVHVDENWYDLGDFTFNFKVDVALSQLAEQIAQEQGFATKLVHYDGFPVDTGTLVTLQYFNPDNAIPVMIVSANIYASAEESYRLGAAVSEALKRAGKRAVLINCSSLSHRFHTHDIEPGADCIARETDDHWNREMLALVEAGKFADALAQTPQYVQAANPEMQFKGFHWLMGALGERDVAARVLAYGPVWGTGAAVVEYSLNSGDKPAS